MGIINARSIRAISMAIPVLSLIFFWFADPKINLWNAGITPGFLIGAANVLLVYWIYKNRI